MQNKKSSVRNKLYYCVVHLVSLIYFPPISLSDIVKSMCHWLLLEPACLSCLSATFIKVQEITPVWQLREKRASMCRKDLIQIHNAFICATLDRTVLVPVSHEWWDFNNWKNKRYNTSFSPSNKFIIGSSEQWRCYSGRLLCNWTAGISKAAHIVWLEILFLCMCHTFSILFFLPAPAHLCFCPSHTHFTRYML